MSACLILVIKMNNRHSIRLKNYDYSSNGAYFVTICTHEREYLFGDIVNGKMKTNNLGNLVVSIWESLPNRFPVIIDTYQIMPNHFHGIIVIVGAGLVPALELGAPVTNRAPARGAPTPKQPTLGNIIGAFKSLSTNTRAQCKFWQRNYYEHIIRNETELFKIREYITLNPLMWERDRNNPENLYV